MSNSVRPCDFTHSSVQSTVQQVGWHKAAGGWNSLVLITVADTATAIGGALVGHTCARQSRCTDPNGLPSIAEECRFGS